MAKKKNGNGKSNGHSNGNGIASRNKVCWDTTLFLLQKLWTTFILKQNWEDTECVEWH